MVEGQKTAELEAVQVSKIVPTVESEWDGVAETDPSAQIVQEVPLRELSHLTVNWNFVRRAWRILGMGLRTPRTAPKLWALIVLDLAFQMLGAYVIQAHLYILATGKDNAYPGISGCLKSGCGKVKTAPGERDLVDRYLGDFAWMFTVSMLFVILMSFAGDMINSAMRRNAAETLQRRLLQEDKLLYRLTVDGTMDNVDQRITSDLQVVLDGFTCVLFGNSADYLAYPVVFMIGRFAFALNACYSLPEVQDPIKRGNIIGVVLAAVFIAFAAYIMPINHVSRIFYRGQRYEGDFRTTHTRAVLNCEQISMLQGETAERDLAEKQFMRVDSNNRIYYFWQGVLLILRLFVSLAIPATSYIALALTETRNSTTANFFQKQVGDVLEYLLYVPVLLERLAFACGATHRVGQLLDQMDRFEASPVTTRMEYNPKRIELRGVHANPPVPLPKEGKGKAAAGSAAATFGEQAAGTGRRALFEGVNLVVEHGQSVCIVGPSGCGKSSLLRVIAGLWGTDEGLVVRPEVTGKDGIFFLPQRPYVFPGTLLAQIFYPLAPSEDPKEVERAKAVLSLVHLKHLVSRHSVSGEVNWPAVLSISEMQRLNFARLFFHKPAFCLADECTSALDLKLESFLYQQCTDQGISMISVAHRPTVLPHHESVFAYSAATHRWSLVPSSEVQTCGKFPTDGLEFLEAPEVEEEDEVEEREEGCNRRFLRRLGRALLLAIGKFRSQGVAFLVIMTLAMGVYGGMTIEVFKDYGTSKIIAQIVGSAPYKRNVQQALNDAGVILGLNGVSAVVQALSCFLGSLLAVKVQRAIVRYFHSNYFAPGVVYHTNRVMRQRGIDQRMVQDLSGFREAMAWLFGNPFAYCNYRVGFLPLSIVWIILCGYSFSLGWQLTVFFLVFMVIAWAAQVFSAVFTSVSVERRQRHEGDLRLHLGRVLQNIESITFFGGQVQEYGAAEGLLESVFWSRMRYSYLANATTFPTITMYYWLQTGVYVMAAILQHYWAPGAIKSADLFTIINFSIIWAKVTQLIIMCMGGFGMVVGFTHRVMHVVEKVEEARKEVEATQGKLQPNAEAVTFSAVSLAVPSLKPASQPRLLVRDLSASIPGSLCATGHGKSSIMRALAGMWPTSEGAISRPAWGKGGIFFVPQANYATQGTLAAQVVYPLLVSEVKPSNAELAAILNEVGLGAILQRWGLHRVVNWDMVLSGGECQRLGFARVLFHQPKFAVLDETTSALDMALEDKCMTALTRRGVHLLSFAARPSVAAYHQQTLHVAKGGVCTVTQREAIGDAGSASV